MKKFGDESGQTLIFVALGLTMLLGFTAFATDVGVLLHQRRLAQTAADSAAIAGAEHLDSGSAAAQAAAKADATANGFTNGQNGATVTVTPSPTTGSFTGNRYMQVTVAQTVPTVFAGLFGRNGMAVSATATATDNLPGLNCVYVLSPNANQAMYLQGSFDVSTPGCGVLVNSNSPTALAFQGGSGTLSASFVNVVGGDSGQVTDSTTVPTLGVAQITDPLAYLNLPSYKSTLTSSCTTAAPASGTSSNPAQLTPGCWSSSGNITLNNVNLSTPGVYTFNLPATGNLILSGNITGTGVTLYLTNGGINATTNSTLNLSAPIATTTGAFLTTASGSIITSTSPGPFLGIVAYIAPPPSTQTQTQVLEVAIGNANGAISGIIYAPDATLFVHDSGGDKSGGTSTGPTLNLTTDFVVNLFNDQTGNLTVVGYTQTQLYSPLNRVTLVE